MADRLGIGTIVITAGLIAMAGTPLSAKSAVQGANAGTIELSAQQNNDKNKKPAAKPAPHRPAPHVNVPHRPAPHVNVQRHAPPRNVQQNVQHPNVQRRVVRPPSNAPKFAAPQNSGPKVINRAARPSGKTTVRTFTPRGTRAHVVTAGRLRGIPGSGISHTSIRGRNYSVWRRGHRIRYHGGYRTFLALSALTAL
ncbi:MAG TPA: hypothetical protein VFX37_08130, partial [Pseudolabrys sp.]|nr:hypothetical protein [Pseudolabrys sp.]